MKFNATHLIIYLVSLICIFIISNMLINIHLSNKIDKTIRDYKTKYISLDSIDEMRCNTGDTYILYCTIKMKNIAVNAK